MVSASSAFRVLVTGGDGFVGQHLVQALSQHLPAEHEIVIGAHGDSPPQADQHRRIPLDVTNPDDVRSCLLAVRPTHLFHLAAVAAIGEARGDVRKTWAVNFGGTLNIALAARETVPDCRILHISSAHVYGYPPSDEPITEAALLDPIDAYGASKAAADIMMGQMAKQALRAIRLRPFNHTGPGQRDQFAAPAFAAQIARIERGEQEPIIRVGTLTSRRDFLDVRDVADAYVRTALRFDELPAGIAMNVASGRAISIADILKILLALSKVNIEVREDPERVRRDDTPSIIGNAARARQLLGWGPQRSIEETLADLLESYRVR